MTDQTRFHVVLFQPGRFELGTLKSLLANATPLDKFECFQHARLGRALHAVEYVPPARRSRAASWDEGLSYFDETLSGQLCDAARQGPDQEVVLLSVDDSRGCSSIWRITSREDERRFITSEGLGVAERVDENGDQHTTTASLSVPEGLSDAAAEALQTRLAAPFAAEPVLLATFGMAQDELTKRLLVAKWTRIWPRPLKKTRATAQQPKARRR